MIQGMKMGKVGGGDKTEENRKVLASTDTDHWLVHLWRISSDSGTKSDGEMETNAVHSGQEW